MKSEVKVYSYPNGEIQRVQVVRWDDWAQLDFLRLKGNDAALDCFYDVYRNYLVPACPWIFGRMVMFRLPEDFVIDLPFRSSKYGAVADALTAVSVVLQDGVKIVKGKPVFKSDAALELWQMLTERDCIRVICGKLPFTKVIPVGKITGYMSEEEPDAALKVNASFFIMDGIDCATVYDHVGTPLDLCVKDGIVMNPPLYDREALLVKKDGSVTIDVVRLKDLEIEVNGRRYKHGKNATIYSRPEMAKTSSRSLGVGSRKLVIIGCRVVAVKESGSVQIPSSGFVLEIWPEKDEVASESGKTESMECVGSESTGDGRGSNSEKRAAGTDRDVVSPRDKVTYHGLEDIQFGMQVGNSIIRDGIKTDRFITPFYNIRKLERIPYAPSLYPMDFEHARAARMAVGADKDGKPMLFWAEGAGKLGYIPGEDSRGATLVDMAELAEDIGMFNGINLDGGGSAQILLGNKRALKISDRNREDNSEAERLVPLGLIVR